MKVRLLLASFALALMAFFATPTQQAQANVLQTGIEQTQYIQPLEMRRHGGWGRRGGWRRGGGWRHRGYYRPRPAYYYGGPVCRVVVRYDRWGYPRRVRRCR